MDDEPKSWNFDYFNRAVNEMQSASTNVGTIMAAIIYQI